MDGIGDFLALDGHEGVVDDLEDFGGQTDILGDDLADAAKTAGRIVEQVEDFAIGLGQDGKRSQAGQDVGQIGGVESIVEGQGSLDHFLEGVGIAGFGDKLVDTSGGTGAEGLIHIAAEHDSNGLGEFLADDFEQLKAVFFGHSQVRNDHIIGIGLQSGEGLLAAADKLHLPLASHGMQHAAEAVENIVFVVNKQDSSELAH